MTITWKRCLHPCSNLICLSSYFEKKCLPVIFWHARWVPFFGECRLTASWKIVVLHSLHYYYLWWIIRWKWEPLSRNAVRHHSPKNGTQRSCRKIAFWYFYCRLSSDHLLEIYIGYLFLKINARYLILKIAVRWYIQVIGFCYICRFRLCGDTFFHKHVNVGPNTSVPYVGVILHKTWTTDAIRTILGRFSPWAVPHWIALIVHFLWEIASSYCKVVFGWLLRKKRVPVWKKGELSFYQPRQVIIWMPKKRSSFC